MKIKEHSEIRTLLSGLRRPSSPIKDMDTLYGCPYLLPRKVRDCYVIPKSADGILATKTKDLLAQVNLDRQVSCFVCGK